MVTLVRRSLEVSLVLFVVGVLGLAIVTQLAPVTGYGVFAVRSESMAPALELGDLVLVQRAPPDDIRPGDVVTIELASGANVTHRVVSLTPTDDGPMLTTQGDANEAPDPVAARAEQLRGLVTGRVPLLGFLLAMLAMPSGIAALFSIGAALLTAVWLLDEVEAGEEDDIEDGLDELRRRLETEPTPATS